MKKTLLLGLLLFVGMFIITGCGSNKQLEEIANKVNESETVKSYKMFGFNIEATANSDTLVVSTTSQDENSKVEFKLADNILSNEKIPVAESTTVLVVLDSVGQTQGYKDGELAQNINAFFEEFQNYTLEKDGLEIVIGESEISLKLDLTKKIPLIDMSNFYLKTDEFDMISEFIADKETGNQSGKTGNIAYDVFVGKNESTIQIGQDGELSDSAYKSILSALEVMYGKKVANKFQKLYPKFVDGKKKVGAYTIVKGYKMEDQDDSMFEGTEIVRITINNKKVK